MLINLHNLMHLPVVTKSGTKLGKVHDFNLDIDNHCVNSYAVRTSLLGKHYLIKPIQIISVTREQIIVEDACIKVIEEGEQNLKTKPATGLAMSKQE